MKSSLLWLLLGIVAAQLAAPQAVFAQDSNDPELRRALAEFLRMPAGAEPPRDDWHDDERFHPYAFDQAGAVVIDDLNVEGQAVVSDSLFGPEIEPLQHGRFARLVQQPATPRGQSSGSAAGEAQAFDPRLVAIGRDAFEESCTQCHEAERATSQRMTLAGWRETVQQMARLASMEGLEIPEEQHEPIAVYLASLGAPEGPPETPRQPQREPSRQDRQGEPRAGQAAPQRTPEQQREQQANQAQIAAGQAAFQRYCTQCHDAARSTSKTKNFAAWMATVRRMAARPGANIPRSEWEPISRYLASLGQGAAGQAEGGEQAAEDGEQATEDALALANQFSVFSTISTTWRGGNDSLENPGFFPEVWVGADWHNESPVSGRVAACVTCHTEGNEGSRIELAYGTARFDIGRWRKWEESGPQLAVEAGRLIVPFGAFAAQSQPGAYRTVTRPLIYNMGQNVLRDEIGAPVLPMPYSDEGAVVTGMVPLGCDWNVTYDSYVVNGLQGQTTGINFFRSRDYVDNNFEPAVGGRVTVGNARLRGGASLMTGRFNDRVTTGPAAVSLDYRLIGADLAYRYEDLLRLQFEYALRTNDLLLFGPIVSTVDEDVEGFYLEGELRVWKKPRVGLIVRYDEQSRSAPIPLAGSSLATGDFTVRRFTWGFNSTLPGGSLLIVNHERWAMPATLEDVDVIGLRWVATF